MYIYPSSPESASSLQSEESAAVKIQAGFRGYRVRKQLYRLNKPSNSSSGSSCGNRSIGHSISSSSSHHQRFANSRRQQHTRVQRGNDLMEERRQQFPANRTGDGQQVPASGTASAAAASPATSMEDRCATKIQAGFRGFLVRKKQKIATDAAVKIQSSFRGFKARKEAEKLKHP